MKFLQCYPYAVTLLGIWAATRTQTNAFVPSPASDFSINSNSFFTTCRYYPDPQTIVQECNIAFSKYKSKESYSRLYFMGSDGGILGIGTPELFTILLVGYFVLGPSDLFKLTKEIGKFVQNFQTFASEATKTFETNMESQLQLEEIRKAQRELNDAFSFRRTINVDDESDPFSVTNQSPRIGDDVVDDATKRNSAEGEIDGSDSPKKKKRIRRIKKKKVPPVVDESNGPTPLLANDIPSELDMMDVDDEYAKAEKLMMESISKGVNENNSIDAVDSSDSAAEAAAQAKKERLERLERGLEQQQSSIASDIISEYDLSAEQSRFQQQVNGSWNERILANNDKLETLAEIMNKLALLEEEKIAAEKRIKEEFKLREENEEKFYLEKRKLLENAATQIQISANVDSASAVNTSASPPAKATETDAKIL